MKLNELIRQAHHLVEAKEIGRITQAEMANRIGVKSRTYTEYQRGTNAPLAMKALLNLLGMLDDDELLKVVHQWNAGNFHVDAAEITQPSTPEIFLDKSEIKLDK